MPVRTGEHLVDILEDLGCEYFFATPGTEFAPIIERFHEKGDTCKLKPITSPDEYLSVNMAYGAYLATGLPQPVMVHTSIGAANAVAGLMNAHRMRIPMIFIAGRTPVGEYGKTGSRDLFIHWAQESYDQGATVREYVKWDYELRDSAMLKDVCNRAWSIAMEEPRGPVYLILPRELLLEEIQTIEAHADAIVPTLMSPEKNAIQQLAELVSHAKSPLILSKTIGETKQGFDALATLCEQFSIPAIFTDAHYCNMSFDHPMNYGCSSEGILEHCDLIINLDMDVPWIPGKTQLKPDCQIVHIGVDPLFKDIPMRSFPGTLLIKSNPVLALQLLQEHLGKIKLNTGDWIKKLESLCTSSNKSPHNSKSLTKHDVAHAIAEIWKDNIVLINELSLPVDSIPMKTFGSYYRTGSASGLGWAGGCALGLGLVHRKDKIIINVVGDGAYYFSNPLAFHWVAYANELPILTIILNNVGMPSIKNNMSSLFKNPDLASEVSLPLLDLSPDIHFEEIAGSFNAIGLKASTVSEFKKVLDIALHEVITNSKQVIINAVI